MRSTFKVLFYVKKGSEKPNGNLPLMCRITVDGEIKQFSCKMDFANLDLNVFNHDAENVFGQFETSFGNQSAVVISRNFAGRTAFVFYGRVLG